MPPETRYWARKSIWYTLNYFTDDDLGMITDLLRPDCLFKTARRGPDYIHGYIHVASTNKMQQIPNLLSPPASVREATGILKQKLNIFHTNGYEFGAIPYSLNGITMKSELTPEDEEETIYNLIKYNNIAGPSPPKRLAITVIWLHGLTGTGKSLLAYRHCQDAYIKDASNKWWDNYRNERAVIIDGVTKDHAKTTHYLQWFHEYPTRVEIKRKETVDLHADLFIVTSNYHPYELNFEQIDSLKRRMNIIELREDNFDQVEQRIVSLLQIYRNKIGTQQAPLF